MQIFVIYYPKKPPHVINMRGQFGKISPVGFEPTRITTSVLKTDPLDHSGTVTFNIIRVTQNTPRGG